MSAKTLIENPVPKPDCHAYACAVAEQGAAMGADIEDVYEMAYKHCVSPE